MRLKRTLLFLLLGTGLLLLALGGWFVEALRWPFSAVASPSAAA